jgi:hypothetical protein
MKSFDESEAGVVAPPRLRLELGDDGLPGGWNGAAVIELGALDESLELDELLPLGGLPKLDELLELDGDDKADSMLLLALETGIQSDRAEAAFGGASPLKLGGSPVTLAGELPAFATLPLVPGGAWLAVAAVVGWPAPKPFVAGPAAEAPAVPAGSAGLGPDCEPAAPVDGSRFGGRGGSEPTALVADFESSSPVTRVSAGGPGRFRGRDPVSAPRPEVP